MKELNPTNENTHVEEARIAVDAVFAEIGLEFPRDETNNVLIKPCSADIARPIIVAEVLTNAGIKEMQATDNHLDFAYAMVAEAHRDVPTISPILSQDDDTDRQFALVA